MFKRKIAGYAIKKVYCHGRKNHKPLHKKVWRVIGKVRNTID